MTENPFMSIGDCINGLKTGTIEPETGEKARLRELSIQIDMDRTKAVSQRKYLKWTRLN